MNNMDNALGARVINLHGGGMKAKEIADLLNVHIGKVKYALQKRPHRAAGRLGGVANRFFRFVSPEPNSGCWLWSGNQTTLGYGRFKFGAAGCVSATHASLALAGRPVPPGMIACHRCDFPPCVNPDHLFIGTSADNSQDMARKGRSAAGLRHPSKTFPGFALPCGDKHWSRIEPGKLKRGETHPRAKLTEDDVRSIRNDQRANVIIAADYGVSPKTIGSVKHAASWRHV